jgi:hypothetical protein
MAMMRTALSQYLLDVHCLLRDRHRDRGSPPGAYLERDLEVLARSRRLYTERRVRRGPHGGVYYSGLSPETDLFVYDEPQFLHIEAKDLCGGLARAVTTEFWARALDLHLGRTRDTLSDSWMDHYSVLVVSSDLSDQMRAACIRWSICLVEPRRIPLAALGSIGLELGDHLQSAGCSAEDLRWACLPFNSRFPKDQNCVLLPFGRRRDVDALLRFQRLATFALRSDKYNFTGSNPQKAQHL